MVLKSKRKIFSNEQKVVLITGASSGLGFELAKKFAGENYLVFALARRKDRLEQLARAVKGKVIPLVVDLNDLQTIKKIVDKIISISCKIDILINNAAWGKSANFIDTNFDEVEGMVRVNCLAPVYLIKHILPEMLKRNKGKIINISSTGGETSLNKMAVYGSTKHFINGLTKNLSRELRGTGVKICTFMPGAMNTDFGTVASGVSSYRGEDPIKIANAIFENLESDDLFIFPTFRSYATVVFNKWMSFLKLR